VSTQPFVPYYQPYNPHPAFLPQLARTVPVYAPKQYEVVYLDPPWIYGGRITHGEGNRTVFGGGADAQYDMMTIEDMMAMGKLVRSILADRAVIHMWVTGPHINSAIEIGKAWGLEYSTKSFCWFKCTKDGKKERGMPGTYTASNTEDVLLFTYNRKKSGKDGNKLTPESVGGRRMTPQTVWDWDSDVLVNPNNGATELWPTGTIAVREPIREHSRKPDVVAERLEQMYPNQTKLEMFCRYPRPNWTVMGNELDGLDVRVAMTLAAAGLYTSPNHAVVS
jgi:N6-adenosine-specific RNA methylase IME4